MKQRNLVLYTYSTSLYPGIIIDGWRSGYVYSPSTTLFLFPSRVAEREMGHYSFSCCNSVQEVVKEGRSMGDMVPAFVTRCCAFR